MLTATPAPPIARSFKAVSAQYDAIVHNAFQPHPSGNGYIFSFHDTARPRYSYSRRFRNLGEAIALLPTITAQVAEMRVEATQRREVQTNTCKVCKHRELDGDGFYCGARAIGRLLLTQDPGADGCRLFKEYRHDA